MRGLSRNGKVRRVFLFSEAPLQLTDKAFYVNATDVFENTKLSMTLIMNSSLT